MSPDILVLFSSLFFLRNLSLPISLFFFIASKIILIFIYKTYFLNFNLYGHALEPSQPKKTDVLDQRAKGGENEMRKTRMLYLMSKCEKSFFEKRKEAAYAQNGYH